MKRIIDVSHNTAQRRPEGFDGGKGVEDGPAAPYICAAGSLGIRVDLSVESVWVEKARRAKE